MILYQSFLRKTALLLISGALAWGSDFASATLESTVPSRMVLSVPERLAQAVVLVEEGAEPIVMADALDDLVRFTSEADMPETLRLLETAAMQAGENSLRQQGLRLAQACLLCRHGNREEGKALFEQGFRQEWPRAYEAYRSTLWSTLQLDEAVWAEYQRLTAQSPFAA
jgi:hypothetical protein